MLWVPMDKADIKHCHAVTEQNRADLGAVALKITLPMGPALRVHGCCHRNRLIHM